MSPNTYSLKIGFKVAAWIILLIVFSMAVYSFYQAIQENMADKIGRWCYRHCLLSFFMFACSFFALNRMVKLIFLEIAFLKDGISIQSFSKNQIINNETIRDISIKKNECIIYLKNGESIYIPDELTNFEDFKRRLKIFYKE